jgi:hypothetical protein
MTKDKWMADASNKLPTAWLNDQGVWANMHMLHGQGVAVQDAIDRMPDLLPRLRDTDPRAGYRRAFLAAYMEAAEWSSLHTPDGTDDTVEIDGLGLSWHPLAEAYARILCIRFINTAKDLLAEADTRRGRESPEQDGHDLWLTSHHHGVGFWCRDELKDGDLGKRLTTACQQQPWEDINLYVGDDNLLHLDGE